jgi:AP endonuclease-1
MPPKRTASVRESQEFEANFSQETDLGEGGSQESIVYKRPRKESSKDSVVEYTRPTNKDLPENIQFPPKLPGTTRLAAWNVSGLVACEKKVCFVFLRLQ